MVSRKKVSKAKYLIEIHPNKVCVLEINETGVCKVNEMNSVDRLYNLHYINDTMYHQNNLPSLQGDINIL